MVTRITKNKIRSKIREKMRESKFPQEAPYLAYAQKIIHKLVRLRNAEKIKAAVEAYYGKVDTEIVDIWKTNFGDEAIVSQLNFKSL